MRRRSACAESSLLFLLAALLLTPTRVHAQHEMWVANVASDSPRCERRMPGPCEASCEDCNDITLEGLTYCIQVEEFVCCGNPDNCPFEPSDGSSRQVCIALPDPTDPTRDQKHFDVSCESDADCGSAFGGASTIRCTADGICSDRLNFCHSRDEPYCTSNASTPAVAVDYMRTCRRPLGSMEFVPWLEGDCDQDNLSNATDSDPCQPGVFYVVPNTTGGALRQVEAQPCTSNSECDGSAMEVCTRMDDPRANGGRYCFPDIAPRSCTSDAQCSAPLTQCRMDDSTRGLGICFDPDRCPDQFITCHTSPESDAFPTSFREGDCDGDGIRNEEEGMLYCSPSTPAVDASVDTGPQFTGGGLTCATRSNPTLTSESLFFFVLGCAFWLRRKVRKR